ncbi:hypothetical protein BSL82_13305 [Tardibacter chloracetimidivorans]|uniref:Uncharacterized protein n=1 Tax=Tardibacter chloracetimidivorans TaxID=1921510 RepID=A0A1L3ZX01_9SPHN|nr:hypothetical protein BSL82_13305 [Tardibacter chloracetimidivorans]
MGVPSSRLFRNRKLFELTVDRLLGGRIRADGAAAIDLWCALANIEWIAPDGDIVSYSQRAAGEMVAWIREEGDYIDWYCSGVGGQVASWIETALAEEGWTWRLM